jgi:hypothetical protein
VVIVGNASVEHLGAHLLAGAPNAGLEATIIDIRDSWSGNKLLDRINFHLLRRRPTLLRSFSERVVAICAASMPDMMLATGISPLSAAALRRIGGLGIRRANLLTDDPWNRTKGAGFFWEALREYDTVFTPRTSNMRDLRAFGCIDVEHILLAYNPEIHFVEHPATEDERRRVACEVAFVGGGDETRRHLVTELLRLGLDLKLYGGYWDRFADTRAHHQGFAIGRDLRLAVSGGFVNLCMGRAANRDQHAMRTFELPAMGACMVVEDSAEHRDVFGPEGECVYYYRTASDIVRHVRALQRNPERARRAAAVVHQRICNGQNTYAMRLKAMFDRTTRPSGAIDAGRGKATDGGNDMDARAGTL